MFGDVSKYRILTRKSITINGIVEDDPISTSFASGISSVPHINFTFPLIFKKIVELPDKIHEHDVPYQEGDVIMVDLTGNGYIKKGYEIELNGKIYELKLKKRNRFVLVFRAKKMFNETLGFSLNY